MQSNDYFQTNPQRYKKRIMCTNCIHGQLSIDTHDRHLDHYSMGTLSTPQWALDRHSINISANSWQIFAQCTWVGWQSGDWQTQCWSSFNQVSTAYRSGYPLRNNWYVNQGYWLRIQIDKFSLDARIWMNTLPQMPLAQRLLETKPTIAVRMQNKNLRGAMIEIHFLEICIFHVRTFCQSLELQLVQIKSVQVLRETSILNSFS